MCQKTARPGRLKRPTSRASLERAPALKHNSFNIRDIATASGVSLTTVSLVMNGRAPNISEPTRRKVLETAKRMGYRPSRLAQGLRAQRAGLLAILVPQLKHAFADVYFGELISAIHERAAAAGQRILLEVAGESFIARGDHLELVHRRFVDGLLCLGTTNDDAFLADFEGERQPMVVVNNYVKGVQLNCVFCDYIQAGRMAASYLVDRGHQHIGLIHGALNVQTSVDFREGVRKVLERGAAPLPTRREADGLYTEEGGYAAATALLRRDPELTAIVAGNDKMAIGAISAIKSTGRRIPDDVSVIGCDDVHSGAFIDPPLTTIHTPLSEIGATACERLLDLVGGVRRNVRDVLPVTMTVRRSVAPVTESGAP